MGLLAGWTRSFVRGRSKRRPYKAAGMARAKSQALRTQAIQPLEFSNAFVTWLR